MVLCDISVLGRCWNMSGFNDVQSSFLDVDVYKWMLSSIPIEVEDVWSVIRPPHIEGFHVWLLKNTSYTPFTRPWPASSSS